MKNIVARVRNYTDNTGQTKGEFVKIGIIGTSQTEKDYVILDPTVSLAGVKLKQDIMNGANGEQPQNGIMCSIFDQQAQQSIQQMQQHPNQQTPNNQQKYSNQQQQNNQSNIDNQIPF